MLLEELGDSSDNNMIRRIEDGPPIVSRLISPGFNGNRQRNAKLDVGQSLGPAVAGQVGAVAGIRLHLACKDNSPSSEAFYEKVRPKRSN